MAVPKVMNSNVFLGGGRAKTRLGGVWLTAVSVFSHLKYRSNACTPMLVHNPAKQDDCK